uniref:Uncharacterized protein n=1 Tax=Oryza meridionalis TaxID=40149 RepID=A0A0E0DJM8_9ORYZ
MERLLDERQNPALARREATAAADPRASEPGGDGGGGYPRARRWRRRIPVRASREATAAINDADDYSDDVASNGGDRKVCGRREAAPAPLSSVPSSILRAAPLSSVSL